MHMVQTYFNHCSIEMNIQMLSRVMLYLANHSLAPITNKSYISPSEAKRINSLVGTKTLELFTTKTEMSIF